MEWYSKRDGILSRAELPESKPPSDVERGSYEHVMFLTLTVALDYQRSANDLWNSARITFEDQMTKWVFSPQEVAKRNHDELVTSLAKYKLSKKKEKDAKIWQTVATSFLELFGGDPRKLFEKYDYDAPQIFHSMRTIYGKKFPYLAGSTGTSKILSLWIRILHDEANIEFKNLNDVPLPIDIHTARSTITTGCLAGVFDGPFSGLVEQTKKAWIEACKGTSYYPLQIDEPLWNLSRFGCTNHRNGQPCPVRDRCRLANFCTANHPESTISIRQNEITNINTKYPEANS